MSKQNSNSPISNRRVLFGPVVAMRLPDVPKLTIVLSVSETRERKISATGISERLHAARAFHDAEREERLVAATHAVRSGLNGMAAGTDGIAAVERRAVCELMERWACMSWWANGDRVIARRPAAAAMLEFSRARANWPRTNERQTGLLQLDAEGLRSVLVAWSCDASGQSVCFGASCDADPRKAAIHTLQELYQMEFGLELERHRAANGLQLGHSAACLLERATTLTISELQPKLMPCQRASQWVSEVAHGSGLCWQSRPLSRNPDVVQVTCPSLNLPSTAGGCPFYVKEDSR